VNFDIEEELTTDLGSFTTRRTSMRGMLPILINPAESTIKADLDRIAGRFRSFAPKRSEGGGQIKLPQQLKGLNSENLLRSLLTKENLHGSDFNSGRNSKIGGAFYLTTHDKRPSLKVHQAMSRVMKE